MGRVRALLTTRGQQSGLLTMLQKPFEGHPLQAVFDRSGPELRQHAEAEPHILRLHPECVLPVDRPYRHFRHPSDISVFLYA
jgi:hypothetical protein